MTPPHTEYGPETTKFLKWYEAEKAKGLIDIKFSTGNLTGATLESFFAEVNRALAARDLADPTLDL